MQNLEYLIDRIDDELSGYRASLGGNPNYCFLKIDNKYTYSQSNIPSEFKEYFTNGKLIIDNSEALNVLIKIANYYRRLAQNKRK